jgi:hypothetical protein
MYYEINIFRIYIRFNTFLLLTAKITIKIIGFTLKNKLK